MLKTEGVHSVGGTDVRYIFRPAAKDTRHLIVIFSGFRARGSVDFAGATTNALRANILWIIDDFGGRFSYYLRAFGGRDISGAVGGVIEEFREKLGLSLSEVTLAGFSKGGSAAIYYGVTGGYKNVVVTVPQLRVGSYVQNYWTAELDSMGGPEAVRELDLIVEDAIAKDREESRSIFLITSPEDAQYETEALPLARLMQRYNNFNLIVSRTPFIREHIDVTRYNVPLVLSLLSMLSEGIVPRLHRAVEDDERAHREAEFWEREELRDFPSAVTNGSEIGDYRPSALERSQGLEARIEKVRLTDGILDFDGYAVQRGRPLTGYGQIETVLRLRGQGTVTDVPLGRTADPGLSLRLFESGFVDYTYGGVTTVAHAGFPLRSMSFGRYSVGMVTRQAENVEEIERVPVAPHSMWNLLHDRIVGSVGSDEGWELLVMPAIGRDATDSYFEEMKCEVREGKLYLEGYFAPRGRTLRNYADIRYSLSLVTPGSSQPQTRIVRSVPLATGARPDVAIRAGEPWREQDKGYYATPHYRGIELTKLAEGEYELYVTARIGDDVQSVLLGQRLLVRGHSDIGMKPVLGVIGSCVTRDNFSSSLVPRWRADYELHGAQYQMSLISLMSEPLDFSASEYADLDSHSLVTTERDFSKIYLEEVARDKPDLLLLDCFADARFGVVRIGNSWVTDNSWKIGASEGYRSLEQNERASMLIDRPQYLALFREACERLRDYLASHSPRTRVVLVSAREVPKFRGIADTGVFPGYAERKLNERWDALDRIVLEVFDCERLEPMDPQVLARSDHPWGKGSVHYEPRYYENFRSQLLEVIRYRTDMEVRAGPPSRAGEVPE